MRQLPPTVRKLLGQKNAIRGLASSPDDLRSESTGEQIRIKNEFHLLREVNDMPCDENLMPADDSPQEVISSPVIFRENKENTPVFERPVKGYTAHQLLDIIIGKRVCNRNICKQVPRAVRTHAAYVVDTKALGSSDIVAFWR